MFVHIVQCFLISNIFFVVCDDNCKDASVDPANGLLVCTISGHCFDRLMSPSDEMDQDAVRKEYLLIFILFSWSGNLTFNS